MVVSERTLTCFFIGAEVGEKWPAVIGKATKNDPTRIAGNVLLAGNKLMLS